MGNWSGCFTMYRILFVIIISVLTHTSAFGFATILHSEMGGDTITLSSNVEDVYVFIDGQEIGIIRKGFIQHKLLRDGSSKVVTFKKEGYRDKEVIIGTKFSLSFFGNIVSGGSYGSSTDSWSTKNVWQYTPNQFYVEMEKI